MSVTDKKGGIPEPEPILKKFTMAKRQVNYNIVTNQLFDESLYRNAANKFEIPRQPGKRTYVKN